MNDLRAALVQLDLGADGSDEIVDLARTRPAAELYVERDVPDRAWLHEVYPADVQALADDERVQARRTGGDLVRPLREVAPPGRLGVPSTAENPVVVLATLTAKPGRRAALVTALEPFAAVADDEAGTETFTVYASDADPDVLWLHEVYTDADAFEVHRSSPIHSTLRADGELTGGPRLMDVLAGKPVNRFLVRR